MRQQFKIEISITFCDARLLWVHCLRFMWIDEVHHLFFIFCSPFICRNKRKEIDVENDSHRCVSHWTISRLIFATEKTKFPFLAADLCGPFVFQSLQNGKNGAERNDSETQPKWTKKKNKKIELKREVFCSSLGKNYKLIWIRCLFFLHHFKMHKCKNRNLSR